jgi:GntR family transcriptional regulator
LFTVDTSSKVPIYEQIKKQIMELILVGVLKPHDQLPPMRQLALELGINFNTVKRAFGDLEADGVIYSFVGRGSFIAENALGSQKLKKNAEKALRAAISATRMTGISRERAHEIVNEIFQEELKK